MSRMEFKGASAQTTLVAGITNSSTSFSIASSTGWPTGSVGQFVTVVDAGTSIEEKILCSALAGGVVTVVTRGYDNTTPVAHAAGAAIYPSVSAAWFDAVDLLLNGGTITAATAATLGLVIKAAAGQTADMLEIQDSTGTVLALIDKNGTVKTGSGGLVTKGSTSGTTTLISPAVAGTGTQVTLPGTSSTLATLAGVETLTNKDLSSATNSFPTSLVTLNGTQTLLNKTLTAPKIQGGGATISGNVSGSVMFDAPSIGSGGMIRLPDVPSSTAQNLLADGSVDVGDTLISTTVLTSGNTAVFSSIPQTYKHLRLVLQGVNPSASDQLNLLIAAVGHSFMGRYVNGSAPTVFNDFASVGAAATALRISGGSVRATNPNAEIIIDIFDYANASANKLFSWVGNYLQAANYEEQVQGVGNINQTAAITTFTLKWNNGTSTFNSGTAKLYGIK